MDRPEGVGTRTARPPGTQGVDERGRPVTILADDLVIVHDDVAVDSTVLADDLSIVHEDRPRPSTARARPRSKRRAYLAAVVLVVLGAGVLRAVGLASGLPYSSYVDEGYVLQPAADMVAEGTWDPGWYNYPSLLIESTAVLVAADDVVADGVGRGISNTAATDRYNELEPTALIVAGRLLVWATSTATVLVTILLASRLAGRRVGLVAGLLVAVVPALVSRSAIAIVDTPATFFVMAALLVASRFPTSRRPLVVAGVAGALSGLAATSKYPAGAVLVAVLVVAALTPARWRRRAAAAAVAVGGAAVAAVTTMPALVLRNEDVAAAIRTQADNYAGKATPTGYLQELVHRVEVGWVIVAPAALGLVLLLAAKRSRHLTIGWIGFVAALAVAAGKSNYQPFRNVLPVVPFLAVAAAVAVVALARWFAAATVRRSPRRRPWVVAGVAGALTAVLVVQLVTGGVTPYLRRSAFVTDSREDAVDWLAAHGGPDERVLVAAELAIPTSERARIPGTVTVVPTVRSKRTPPGTVVGGDPRDYDVVVVGRFSEPVVPELVDGTRVAATFGTKGSSPSMKVWLGSSQVVEIRTPT